VALCALLVAATAQAQVTLDAPRGGWKHSGGEPAQHLQDVNYPASRVNAGGPRSREDGSELGAAIRGRIAGATAEKARQPHLLVVNGVAMPLSVNADGSFARPYAFPPGANSVEVRTPDRKQGRRVNFYDANAARQRVGLRIVLSWDSDMTDIDLHVHLAGRSARLFRGAPRPGTAARSTSMSPAATVRRSMPSRRRRTATGRSTSITSAAAWAAWAGWATGSQEITIAQVAIITREGTPDEKLQVFRVPLRRPGELTLVKSFVYP
jgi:uncharacterized protein YfaP (DUF2135 family)